MSNGVTQNCKYLSRRLHTAPQREDILTRSYSRGYPDVSSVARTSEDFLTQLSPGDMVCHARTVSVGRASLIGLWERPKCVGGSVLSPDLTGVLFPLCWDDEFVMNGHCMARGEVYSVDSPLGFLSRGVNRYFYGLQVERQALLNSLAALQGVQLEDVTLPHGPLRLTYGFVAWLSYRFHREIHRAEDQGMTQQHSRAFVEFLYQVMLEIHSFEQPSIRPRSGWRRATQIVRLAEARFAAMQGASISLADLCAASCSSSTTLYQAFEQVVGMPPLRYFRARGINTVHQKLLKSANNRGAVTECATSHGFTELGRFSIEYKKIFGVSPSVTLAAVSSG